MRTRTLGSVIVIGVFVALFGMRSAAQSTDPIIGKWVLNAQSRNSAQALRRRANRART